MRDEEKKLWITRFPRWNSQALTFLRGMHGFSARVTDDYFEVQFCGTRSYARYVEDYIIHRCESADIVDRARRFERTYAPTRRRSV